MCKMAVLGRGSMRDRKKEEELRSSGDSRYAHLFDDLHVEISTFAAPAEAHARIAYALAEVRRFLVPVSALWRLFHLYISMRTTRTLFANEICIKFIKPKRQTDVKQLNTAA